MLREFLVIQLLIMQLFLPCEKRGEWQEALKLFNEMDGKRVPRNTITYSAAISACEKGGRMARSIKIIQRDGC